MKTLNETLQPEHSRLLEDWLPDDHAATRRDLQALQDNCRAARQQLTDKVSFERLRALGVGVSAALWVLDRLPNVLRRAPADNASSPAPTPRPAPTTDVS